MSKSDPSTEHPSADQPPESSDTVEATAVSPEDTAAATANDDLEAAPSEAPTSVTEGPPVGATEQPPAGYYGPQGQPMPFPPAKPKPNLFIIIGIVVVALVAVIVGAVLLAGGGDDPTRPVTPGQAKAPEAAVRGYLQAIAAGNAEDALSFAAVSPIDMTYLTDEMLAASLAINPITEITVTLDEMIGSKYAYLSASYQIGSTTVNASFHAEKFDKYFLIDDVACAVGIYGYGSEGPPMTINGQPISLSDDFSARVYLFPGSYVLEQGNPYLTISDNQFLVTSPSDHPDADYKLSLREDVGPEFADLAIKTLKACMKEKTTFTTCGFGSILPIYKGKPLPIKSSTIKWSFSGSAPDYSNVEFNYYLSHPLQAEAYRGASLRLDVKGTDGKSYYLNTRVSSVKIDFSDPNNLKVIFN